MINLVACHPGALIFSAATVSLRAVGARRSAGLQPGDPLKIQIRARLHRLGRSAQAAARRYSRRRRLQGFFDSIRECSHRSASARWPCQPSPSPGAVPAIRPLPAPPVFRLRSAAHGPERALEVQLTGSGFDDNTVKVAAGRGPKTRYLLGRDNRAPPDRRASRPDVAVWCSAGSAHPLVGVQEYVRP